MKNKNSNLIVKVAVKR